MLTQCAGQSDAGKLVVLNNGIEIAATCFVVLLALYFIEAGRFVSADCWIAQRWRSRC